MGGWKNEHEAFEKSGGSFTGGFSRSRDDSRLWRRKESIGAVITAGSADAEGYSGLDGRTTIFDYWSVASVRRWLNRGDCRGSLRPDQKALRDLYGRILRLAATEPAIAGGGFFDLMYVNYTNPRLNPHRHYVYLRHKDDDILLIAVNFGDEQADIAVNIPAHAFNTLDTPQGTDPGARELLTGASAPMTLSASEPTELTVPAHGAAIWRLSAKAMKPQAPAPKKRGRSAKAASPKSGATRK